MNPQFIIGSLLTVPLVWVVVAVLDAALAAAVRSTETRSRLGPQGRQSGGNEDCRNAQNEAGSNG